MCAGSAGRALLKSSGAAICCTGPATPSGHNCFFALRLSLKRRAAPSKNIVQKSIKNARLNCDGAACQGINQSLATQHAGATQTQMQHVRASAPAAQHQVATGPATFLQVAFSQQRKGNALCEPHEKTSCTSTQRLCSAKPRTTPSQNNTRTSTPTSGSTKIPQKEKGLAVAAKPLFKKQKSQPYSNSTIG